MVAGKHARAPALLKSHKYPIGTGKLFGGAYLNNIQFKPMIPNFFKLTILCYVIAALYACKEGNQSTETTPVPPADNTTASVDTQVVLTVGTERFTAFEMQKHVKMFKQKFYQLNHSEPTEADIKNWVKEFTDRAFVLADARAKGYYIRKDVNDEVEATAMLMIGQAHGLLEKKLTADVSGVVPGQAGTRDAQTALINNYRSKINNAAQVKLNKPAIIWLQSVIDKDKQKNTLRTEALKGNLDKELAAYRTPEGKPQIIQVKDLVAFYNTLPIRRYLNDTAVVSDYLKQLAINSYIKNDAEKMGVTTDPEFKLNKKSYTDGVVYQKYVTDNLGTNRGVTEADLLKVYASVKQTLSHPTDIVYSLYTFNNAPNAYKALGKLRMVQADSSISLNALSQKRHIKFNKNDTHLPDTLKKAIYSAAPGRPVPPVETNGYFTVIFIESASGSEPYKPDEIKPYLTSRAMEQKELAYNAQKATQLKSLKVKNNVNVKDLAGTRLTSSL